MTGDSPGLRGQSLTPDTYSDTTDTVATPTKPGGTQGTVAASCEHVKCFYVPFHRFIKFTTFFFLFHWYI